MMVVPDRIKTQGLCNEAVGADPGLLAYTPDRVKTQEVCNEAVAHNSYTLRFIPDHLKTQEMCNEVMRNNPAAFFLIPDHFKTQAMCTKAIEVNPWQLYYAPDHIKTQEKQLKIWHYGDDYCIDDELIKWYEGHQKRKAQKAKIKEELLLIAWHPNRVMDWCVSKDGKGWWE